MDKTLVILAAGMGSRFGGLKQIEPMGPNGEFIIDENHKLNGRGAYICPSKECFEKAVKSKGLERSFKHSIPKEVYEKLEKELDAIETE